MDFEKPQAGGEEGKEGKEHYRIPFKLEVDLDSSQSIDEMRDQLHAEVEKWLSGFRDYDSSPVEQVERRDYDEQPVTRAELEQAAKERDLETLFTLWSWTSNEDDPEDLEGVAVELWEDVAHEVLDTARSPEEVQRVIDNRPANSIAVKRAWRMKMEMVSALAQGENAVDRVKYGLGE